jgi:hypothetical protein
LLPWGDHGNRSSLPWGGQTLLEGEFSMRSFLIATFVALTTCSQVLAQAPAPAAPAVPGIPPIPAIPAVPALLPAPTAFPIVPPPGLTNNQIWPVNMALSEGNRISFVAYGKYASMYGSILSQTALLENGNQQMRRQAHEAVTNQQNIAYQIRIAEINARPVVNIQQNLGTQCGTRSCGCGHSMPVYRSWSSTRNSWWYRSRCYRTGRTTYSHYGNAPGMTWGRGFGHGYGY